MLASAITTTAETQILQEHSGATLLTLRRDGNTVNQNHLTALMPVLVLTIPFQELKNNACSMQTTTIPLSHSKKTKKHMKPSLKQKNKSSKSKNKIERPNSQSKEVSRLDLLWLKQELRPRENDKLLSLNHEETGLKSKRRLLKMKKKQEKKPLREHSKDRIVHKQEDWKHKDSDSKPERPRECIEEHVLQEGDQTKSTE